MKLIYTLVAISFLVAVNSCSKKDDKPAEEQIVSYDIKGQDVPVTINAALHTISIHFPDSVTNANNLVADFTLSPGCTISINNTVQTSGVSQNSYNTPFTYTVSNASGNVTDWRVYSVNNTYTPSWGLGGFIDASNANNRSYSWYIDQLNTGFDSADNCGPSCVTMACKWADSTFTKTAHEARLRYESQGGWWSTGDIDNYLSDNSVTHKIVSLPATAEDTKQFLKRQVDLKQIVILNIDMSYIRQGNDATSHADRFYYSAVNDGHFFIVKGYKEVDNEMYFEIYDPFTWGSLYYDGSPKGQDRYYRYEDVFAAANVWWQYAFIIAKKGAVITERIAPSSSKIIPLQFGH